MESREQVLSLIKRGTPISRKRVEKGGWKTDASSPRCYFYVLPIGFALRSCCRSSIEARRQFDFFSRVVAVTCLSRRKSVKIRIFLFRSWLSRWKSTFFLKSRSLFYLFPFFPRDQERCHHPLEPDIYESARIGGIFNGRKKRSITQFLFRTITYRRKNELAYSELAYKTHNPSNRQPISTPSFDSVRKKKRKEIERPIFPKNPTLTVPFIHDRSSK